MKKKIQISNKLIKRVLLIVVLVVVVVLLSIVTIDSFKTGKVSSNCTVPNENIVSGQYAQYLEDNGNSYPSAYSFSFENNHAIEGVYDNDLSKEVNELAGYTVDEEFLTGQNGTFTDRDGVDKEYIYSGKNGSLVYKFNVPEAGYYNIILHYVGIDDKLDARWEPSGGANIERKVYINGVMPFDDLLDVSFSRTWADGGEPLIDLSGNQIKPAQVELFNSNYSYVKDPVGYVTEPYCLYFQAGENTVQFEAVKENMGIIEVFLASKESYITYDTYKASYANVSSISNQNIKIEGEAASARSSSTIYAVNDKTSAYTTTADGAKASPVKLILNTIGGSKWTDPGSWIEWTIDVPETGMYEITLRSKQNVSRGLFSTRKLYIDNSVPFSEAQNCKFVYNTNYRFVTLGSNDGEAYKFYLTAGKHTLRMECTLGDYASEINRIQDVIDVLNGLYREIIKKTGISPDPYIDYFANESGRAFIAHAQEEFKNAIDVLYSVSANITAISGEKSSETAALDKMAVQLGQFIKNYRRIQKSLSDFSTNISSLGTWILNVSEQALQIDYILVHTDDVKIGHANPNIFVSTWFGIKGFVGSFFFDYESVGLTAGHQDWEEVEVWLLTSSSTGREQANAISSMIYEAQSEAENNPNSDLYGINVKLKVVASGVLLTATLAHRGPDVAINLDNGTPVNYALRGAIHDISGFADFDTVCQRFMDSALTPYKYTDSKGHTGCYALPYTQSFLVMFYRTDMFEEYGWEVPTTWNQVLMLIPELQIMNFQFYLPLNQAGATSVVNQIFASYLYQTTDNPKAAFYRTIDYVAADGSTQQYIESNFDSEESMQAFEFWCSFYTDYSFPLSASFINRFRSGETPIGIAGYDMYNTLAVSAPEIRGKWAFALLPGVEEYDEYGNPYIDHTGAASGSALVMMEQADNYENAWKFMKWFTSADTQVGYAREVESILGSAARLNTANVEAFNRLAWTTAELEVLNGQWVDTIGVPEVPGGYYTGRNLENAFRYVVNNKQNPRTTLTDYIRTINSEINRKRNEFGLGTLAEYESLYGEES